MGHRKKSAPRRGSLAYRPRGRATSIVPTVRTWPELSIDKPSLLGFAGFKAGSTHVITIDDREKTPNFGKPVFNPATIISTPPIFVYGMRAYGRSDRGMFVIGDAYSEKLPKSLSKKRKAPRSMEGALKDIEANLDRVAQLSAIVSVYPKDAGLSQKESLLFEMGVSGGDMKARFEYLKSLLGKEIVIGDVVKPGTYVDVISVSKGKGIEGPVTRFGIKRKQAKSRKSVRAVATLGPWHPAAVMYTVPRAGQMGYHQRVEYNKRVLSVSNSKETVINPKGGFADFGIIDGDYIVLKGSVTGPAKRLVKIRLPLRSPRAKVLLPKIVEMGTRK
ncbi:MAG: 50S ribosomal protein L3 [Nitrososphaerales archaeon]|nr:50S ribosomal protein L3 [Nitrososphaerales archaeon]